MTIALPILPAIDAQPLVDQLLPYLKRIIMNQAEFKAALDGVVASLTTLSTQLSDGEARLEKALAEVLEAAKTAGNTTPEMDATLQALQDVVSGMVGKGQAIADTAQALDDVNKDAPAP